MLIPPLDSSSHYLKGQCQEYRTLGFCLPYCPTFREVKNKSKGGDGGGGRNSIFSFFFLEIGEKL
jgi:hypothetical protein